MRRYFKFIAGYFLIPITRWYLRKQRNYRYEDIRIIVLPTVFHPGFFGSTKFILEYLKKQNLKNVSFLELGCGSGLISVFAAGHGANVTALDLNPVAVENTSFNGDKNKVILKVIQSDLFENVPSQTFDLIAVNPPYYPKTPVNNEERAWYCGDDFLYFKNLFGQVGAYMSASSIMIMVLSQACDIASIEAIAKKAGFTFDRIAEEGVFFEAKNFLFSIRKK